VTATQRELFGAWNFRDVAEVAAINPGRFFRSSELSGLDDAGRKTLRTLGISDVADLRSPQEVQRRGPGAVPDGVTIHLLPFPDLSNNTAEAPHESSWRKMMEEQPDGTDPNVAAIQFMTEEYRKFPTLRGAQNAVRQVITLLADARPVITHCFAGKDRTGFTVAVTLEAIGVHQDAIHDDFLRSNLAIPALRERILESVRERSRETPEIVTFAESRLTDEVLGVRIEYLQTARRVIDDVYGGLEGYLAESGVTAADIDRARHTLLG
jgi:protein-tyrosine phosphatase